MKTTPTKSNVNGKFLMILLGLVVSVGVVIAFAFSIADRTPKPEVSGEVKSAVKSLNISLNELTDTPGQLEVKELDNGEQYLVLDLNTKTKNDFNKDGKQASLFGGGNETLHSLSIGLEGISNLKEFKDIPVALEDPISKDSFIVSYVNGEIVYLKADNK